jgi:biopolymer transport protein ExbD
MASRFHRARQRRVERQALTDAGNLNLVPLVDILTSIVFFSLLTYTGAALMTLTAFDLTLPPVVVTGTDARASAPENQLNLVLAVRIREDGFRVEHSGTGDGGQQGFMREIAGTGPESLDQLQQLMSQIRQQYAANEDVTVIPDDAVLYDEVIQVLTRLRAARFTNISLANRARGEPRVAMATGGE